MTFDQINVAFQKEILTPKYLNVIVYLYYFKFILHFQFMCLTKMNCL